jgi:O-antigen/teichoic acid export membrane protein
MRWPELFGEAIDHRAADIGGLVGFIGFPVVAHIIGALGGGQAYGAAMVAFIALLFLAGVVAFGEPWYAPVPEGRPRNPTVHATASFSMGLVVLGGVGILFAAMLGVSEGWIHDQIDIWV